LCFFPFSIFRLCVCSPASFLFPSSFFFFSFLSLSFFLLFFIISFLLFVMSLSCIPPWTFSFFLCIYFIFFICSPLSLELLVVLVYFFFFISDRLYRLPPFFFFSGVLFFFFVFFYLFFFFLSCFPFCFFCITSSLSSLLWRAYGEIWCFWGSDPRPFFPICQFVPGPHYQMAKQHIPRDPIDFFILVSQGLFLGTALAFYYLLLSLGVI